MEINKIFLETFINSLTKLSNDNIFFHKMPKRQFNISYTKKNSSVLVEISYLQDGFCHILLSKESEYDLVDIHYEFIYFELLRVLFLTQDSIGIVTNNKGDNIDLLSMSTLLCKGTAALNKA